jgi:hypothetical protein
VASKHRKGIVMARFGNLPQGVGERIFTGHVFSFLQ